jgi:hypothetical protein
MPGQIERLLPSMAANQVSIGLQEARGMTEQKRIAAELDRRVAERTVEPATANAELRKEIVERESAAETSSRRGFRHSCVYDRCKGRTFASRLVMDDCESGGIGRRTRLRIWRVKPWGFESPLSHQIHNLIPRYLRAVRELYEICTAASGILIRRVDRGLLAALHPGTGS